MALSESPQADSPSAVFLTPDPDDGQTLPDSDKYTQAVTDFDRDGEWDEENQIGPAIHCPTYIKDIVVVQYRIEWLSASDEITNFYAKNHMVSTLVFASSVVINGVRYRSARLSIETSDEPGVVADLVDQEEWVPGTHYLPGTYEVAMLIYADQTHSATHFCTYPVRGGTTIGHLIDKILELKMHHFLFLPYTGEGRWKGCGDHVLHCWAHFVREGDITSSQSIETGASLCDEIVYTYLTPTNSTLEHVGRGWWVSHNPKEDELTPETTFTDRRVTYQLPPELQAPSRARR